MENAVYKLVEIVGASSTSTEDAINTAIEKASRSIHNLEWFEVVQTRGCIDNNKVKQYQVILKVGFRVDD